MTFYDGGEDTWPTRFSAIHLANLPSSRTKQLPANSLECAIDAAGPGAGPLGHADWQVTLIDAGTSFDFSTSSAMTLCASA